jgi:HD domain-containing protein
MYRDGLSTHVAAVDKPQVAHTERWRFVATRAFYVLLAASGAALLLAFPPTFDTRIGTVFAVIIVSAFVVFAERSQTAAGSTVAPLTAIMAASAVTLGAWAIVIGAIAVSTIQIRRLRDGDIGPAAAPFVMAGQIGIASISSYLMLATWNVAHDLIARWPIGELVITFAGVICVGIVWQTSTNVLVAFGSKVAGSRFPVVALLRPGIVASLYAYMLVGMYDFGGIFATALFYIVVAQFNFVQQTLGTSVKLLKLDRAQDQAATLVRDLSHLLEAESVEFGREVRNIAQSMARSLSMSRREVSMVGLAAELHEIGKCRIPYRVRTNVRLTEAEIAQYMSYPRIGAVMVRSSDALLPREIADWIEFHREHFDGAGGPRGLRGDAIPLASRIIAIARAYVAMLTGYDGMDTVNKETALARLNAGGGALYDPGLVDLLENLVQSGKHSRIERVHEVADAG